MAYDYPPESSYIASKHGAVIHLHHPDVDPVPEEGKILVSPGTSNFIAVTKVKATNTLSFDILISLIQSSLEITHLIICSNCASCP